MLSKFQNQTGKLLNEFPWLFIKKLPFSFELPASPPSWSITVRTKCCKRLAWAFSRDTWIAEAGSRWLIKMRRVQCLVWLLQGDSGLWGHEVSGNAISFIKSPQRFHFSSHLRHSSVFLSAASQLKAEWRFPSEYIFFNPVLLNFLCYLQMFTSTFSLKFSEIWMCMYSSPSVFLSSHCSLCLAIITTYPFLAWRFFVVCLFLYKYILSLHSCISLSARIPTPWKPNLCPVSSTVTGRFLWRKTVL